MKSSPDSYSRARARGKITRAATAANDDTAEPALTSGFGAVIAKEHDLRLATAGCVGRVSGANAADLDRILHHQHTRLGVNIALLEQRYESLPRPERFVPWHERGRLATQPRVAAPADVELIPGLLAQHLRLLADMHLLIASASDGQRGELILTEVGRSHEEMAWMLTALLKDDESVAHQSREVGLDGTESEQKVGGDAVGPVSRQRPPG